MNGTSRQRPLTLVICSLSICVAGCAGVNKGEGISFWPFGQKKTSQDNSGVLSPPEEIAMLQKLAKEASSSTPERQQRISNLLAAVIQKESDPLIRAEIVRTLGKFRTATADSVLCAALKDPEVDVRLTACETLAKRGGSGAVAALSEAVSGDMDTDVRLAAARALGQTHDPAAVAALGSVLEDADPAMQHRAVLSLRSVTGKDLGNDVNRWRQYVKGEPLKPARSISIAERLRAMF